MKRARGRVLIYKRGARRFRVLCRARDPPFGIPRPEREIREKAREAPANARDRKINKSSSGPMPRAKNSLCTYIYLCGMSYKGPQVVGQRSVALLMIWVPLYSRIYIDYN